MHHWNPWELSTGLKTVKGKARVSKNARKDGTSFKMRELIKEVNKLLKE